MKVSFDNAVLVTQAILWIGGVLYTVVRGLFSIADRLLALRNKWLDNELKKLEIQKLSRELNRPK